MKVLGCIAILTSCVLSRAAIADPCDAPLASSKVSIVLIKKSEEVVDGIKQTIGTFRIANHQNSTIVLSGSKENIGFYVSFPDAWLQGKLSDGKWHRSFDDLAGAYAVSPDKLSIDPNSENVFIAPIHPYDPNIPVSAKLRLVVPVEKATACIASNPFSQ